MKLRAPIWNKRRKTKISVDPTLKAFTLMLFLHIDVKATQQTNRLGDEEITDN